MATEHRSSCLLQEFEHIKIHRDVNYFKALDGVTTYSPNEDRLAEMLNHQLKKVTDQYNSRLKDLLSENKNMFQQLIRLKVIRETLGLDLSLEGFIERLLSIGSDADAIWDEINRQIPGYFAKTIKKAYSISDKNESFITQYNEHLQRSKIDLQSVIKT
jgi:hypothetical protein